MLPTPDIDKNSGENQRHFNGRGDDEGMTDFAAPIPYLH
jgi:hypothetical protein